MRKTYLSIIVILVIASSNAQKVKILFDATKAETAGSADWVIEAHINDLNWTTKSTVTTGGTHADALQLPTPDQSTVTASTVETYWTGALSSWGIDCVNYGFHVETLPYNGKITYGDATNPQDLSNYKVYIVCEPNIWFTTAEKQAMINFVKNGGGLFMISDHAGSDRNNDGSDSPSIWDDFEDNNGVAKNPFGIKFDSTNPNAKLYPSDITEVSTNVSKTSNPITNGPYGTVTKVRYDRGTTLTLDNTANPSVKGAFFANEATTTTSGAMCAYATYSKGRVVGFGDSSPCDDGTGATAATLYKSYSGDKSVGDNHRYLFMNAVIWLAGTTLPVELTGFTASENNSTVTLNWTVANEINFDGYSIEKSVDGVTFSFVSFLKASNKEAYHCSDVSNNDGIVYYRLKLINNDGSFTYSNILKVVLKQQNELLNLYPNPTSGSEIKVKFNTLNNNATASVNDIVGKVIAVYPLNKGINSFTIPTCKLAKGTYILSIKQTEKKTISTSFIKN